MILEEQKFEVRLSSDDGREWVGYFSTRREAQSWLDKQLSKPGRDSHVINDRTNQFNRELYKQKRLDEYPSVNDQLEMIYEDIDNWKDTIKTIRDKYPKPIA